jgi:MFS transporter, ACS family, tartrate transporter
MSQGPHVDRFGDRWMNIVWRKPPGDIGERTRRRVTVHILPFLFFLYILAYLDRFNISVAALGMNRSPAENGLGFTDDIVGFGAGLFFWGYWILEMPSTMSVAKWGARWVFMRILVLWGICAAMCGLIGLPIMNHLFGWLPQATTQSDTMWGAVTNFIGNLHTNAAYQFYFFRFMLGFFEGGFFPTVIVFLSYWFRGQDRAKAIACFMAAIPFSGAIGMPVSGLLLDVNWWGLPGWRWVLILQGVLPVVAGVATFFLLPNRPIEANWLANEERDALQAELDEEHRKKQGHGHWAWVHHLGMVLLLTLVYFGLNVSSYGLSMFMPAIIKSQTGVGDSGATWLAGLYYSIATVAMLFNGWHSDHTHERIWHVSIPLAIQGTGIFLAATFDNVAVLPLVIVFTMVATCHYAHLPAFWPIPTVFLGAIAAASAIGFINMVGNLGGFFGPKWVGSAVTEDIKWLKGQIGIDQRDQKFLPTEIAAPLQAELDAASTEKTVREVRSKLPEGQQISQKNLDRYTAIETNLDEGQKLSPADAVKASKYLAMISMRLQLSQEQSQDLFAMLTRGASFSSGLKRLAPWPIMSAIIILLVGYFRKRAPVPTGAN